MLAPFLTPHCVFLSQLSQHVVIGSGARDRAIGVGEIRSLRHGVAERATEQRASLCSGKRRRG